MWYNDLSFWTKYSAVSYMPLSWQIFAFQQHKSQTIICAKKKETISVWSRAVHHCNFLYAVIKSSEYKDLNKVTYSCDWTCRVLAFSVRSCSFNFTISFSAFIDCSQWGHLETVATAILLYIRSVGAGLPA